MRRAASVIVPLLKLLAPVKSPIDRAGLHQNSSAELDHDGSTEPQLSGTVREPQSVELAASVPKLYSLKCDPSVKFSTGRSFANGNTKASGNGSPYSMVSDIALLTFPVFLVSRVYVPFYPCATSFRHSDIEVAVFFRASQPSIRR
ncbi:hypothetical protein AUEXF2481DRAFT_547700 [Aureobasidium subglaciale EXF-2481]|uniref:Uncharacterized protein n=1 Tax=Aureobasidium subglaciale (strain EXF-2481) TaxID=1043005 RepID=A0A074YJ31_AURSE|nr:uncharacterized protein AUEXF2481DRAFT_547700 [Aureobasidium subglaciale EXF-2481]KEQ97813.1 hypothetical protein AUEXF2481DRAFT_547700 [Aureobasidium subglaciale EXF-2481]